MSQVEQKMKQKQTNKLQKTLAIRIIQKIDLYRAFLGGKKKKSEWGFLKINKYINIFFWFEKYDTRTTYVFFIDFFFVLLFF